MNEENLKSKTISGLLWQFAQKAIGQLFGFVVTVILARLLLPADYGVVALASLFNILVGIFISGSMDAALIQKKDADDLDYNTVFYSSLFMSFVIYGVVYFGAPVVAHIYDNQLITPLMRVLALTMPLGALSMVQSAHISREMQFKKFFYASLIGQVIAAVAGIAMAYHGYGPWALVAQSMISALTNTLVMCVMVSWRPRLMFSFERLRSLLDFAWKKTAAGFIGTLCFQLKGYLIGYKYSMADLAYFNRGEGLPEMLMNNINGSINGVLFPALSKVSGDADAFKRAIRRAMMTSSYVLAPLLLGLAAVSPQVVVLLYTDKWSPAIPFMQVACLTACMTVLNTANLQAFYAIGQSGEVLKLEIYKKPMMLTILFVAIFISPLAISIGLFFYSIYVLYVNTRPNEKYLNYTLGEQIRDVRASFLLAGTMALLVYGLGLLIPNQILALVVQILFGATYYIGLSHLFHLEEYIYIKKTIREIINKRK